MSKSKSPTGTEAPATTKPLGPPIHTVSEAVAKVKARLSRDPPKAQTANSLEYSTISLCVKQTGVLAYLHPKDVSVEEHTKDGDDKRDYNFPQSVEGLKRLFEATLRPIRGRQTSLEENVTLYNFGPRWKNQVYKRTANLHRV